MTEEELVQRHMVATGTRLVSVELSSEEQRFVREAVGEEDGVV